MFDARVAQLGLVLPGPFPPHDPLDPVVVRSALGVAALPRGGPVEIEVIVALRGP